MSIRQAAIHALNTSRNALNLVLEEFKTDDDWFTQPCPNSNHAIWIVGHLGLADNRFASRFRPDVDQIPEGWEELFWFGSEINPDRAAYPSKDDVLAYFHERRETLLKVIEECSDEELNAAAPPAGERGPISGAPNVGQLFLFGSFHEGIHMGQLTVAHRSLGREPVMKPQPAESNS